MKRLFLILFAISVLLGTASIALASDISDALYYGVIRATNSSTLAENVSTNVSINSTSLIASGIINSTADDVAIRKSGGTDTPFMPGYGGNPWAVWFDSVPENASVDVTLYTNASNATIYWFPGDGGATVADNDTSLELDDNFDILWKGNLGDTGYLVDKPDAIEVSYNATSENLTVSTNQFCLDFVRTNSDWVEVGDDIDFSFTDGAGTDKPFSITAWVKFDDVTGSWIVSKATVANKYEWNFGVGGDDKLTAQCIKNDNTAWIGRVTNAITSSEGTWKHYAMTYNGNELNSGFNIYINGVDSDTADSSNGAYTGMSNTDSGVEIGARVATAYMDGCMARLKIYKDRCLTPAEVLADYTSDNTTTTGLVGQWEMDEGTGDPTDSSGNGHDGTNHGADWVISSPFPGQVLLTATSISPGAETVLVSANTTHLSIFVDDFVTAKATDTLPGAIPNSPDDYTFCSNGCMPYVEYVSVNISGVNRMYIDWEYGTVFHDSSGNDNDATPTFRMTCSDADVSTSLISFTPVELAEADEDVAEEWPSMMESPPDEPSTAYTEEGHPGIFFEPLVDTICGLLDIPESFFWYNFAFFIIIGAGMLVFYFFAKNNTQALLIKIIVMGALMALFALPGPNIYGFYVVIYFAFFSFGVLVLSRSYGW